MRGIVRRWDMRRLWCVFFGAAGFWCWRPFQPGIVVAGRRVHFVMSPELLERIDAALDGVSRGEFVRRAVEQALGRDGRRDSNRHRYLPTPAEQPRQLSRSEMFKRATQGGKS